MSKILSQGEIDALLTSISVGQAESVEVTSPPGSPKSSASVYDFKHPNRMSRDQQRTLESIHERFARSYRTFLTSIIGLMTDITLTAIDQVTYSEFVLSMPDPSCIYVFTIEELGGDAILEVNPQLVLFMVDRLLGGHGWMPEKLREITAIEQNIMRKPINRAFEMLSNAWHPVVPLTLNSKAFHTNPELIQITSAQETVLSISFEVRIRDFSSLLNICLPYLLLEDIMPRLSIEEWSTQDSKKASQQVDERGMKRTLMKVAVPIAVELGTCQMLFKDMIALCPNDIIQLDQRPEDEVKILVDNDVKFYARPGSVGNKRCVQISRAV